MLTLAKIATNYTWCQDFLENIFQELELVAWDDGSCPLLVDATKDESTAKLWDSCVSDQLIEQQTAVRLLLLVGRTQVIIATKFRN